MGPEVSFTLLIPQRCFPQYGKKSFALDLVVFGLPVSVSSERGLSPPERSERKRRDSWFPAAFFHLHLLQWAQIHHTFPRSDVLQSRSNTMQQNHTQAEQEKPLSSTCNGDLCLHKLKALLLQFLLYKNGAMGMAKLQLGWNTRAIYSEEGTLAGPSWRASFSPLIFWCPALHRYRDHVCQ